MSSNRLVAGVACVIFMLGFLALGAGLVVVGVQHQQTADAISETELIDVAAMEPGQVAVSGTAHPTQAGEGIERPFDDAKVLALYVEVSYLEEPDPDDDDEREYVDAFSAGISEPLVVDDGTGRARVDPPDSLGFPTLAAESTVRQFDDADELLDALEPLAQRRPEVDESDLDEIRAQQPRDQWRYSIRVVEPNDEVYVLGQASEQPDADGGFVIEAAADSDPFVLSAYSRSDTESRLSQSGTLLIGSGILIVVVGIVLPAVVFRDKVL